MSSELREEEEEEEKEEKEEEERDRIEVNIETKEVHIYSTISYQSTFCSLDWMSFTGHCHASSPLTGAGVINKSY